MDEELTPYDEQYLVKGSGFVNLGATCYFNSMLQCLLSCPVVFQKLTENKSSDCVQKNPLAKNLLELYEAMQRGESTESHALPIWRSIVGISQSKNNKIKMDFGQQDAHEGFMMLMDVFDTVPFLKRLFEYRHRIRITCDSCQKVVSDTSREDTTFEVQAGLRTEQHEKFREVDTTYGKSLPLSEFLLRQNGYVDGDYRCPECSSIGVKYKETKLTMVPEILAIAIKRYKSHEMTMFPETLEVPRLGGSKMVYKLVAQSEHSGSMSGGHYWAIAKRADGWKNLNDTHTSDATPGPTANTYMLFYNYTGCIDKE